MLQSMRSQKVGHNLVTEQQQKRAELANPTQSLLKLNPVPLPNSHVQMLSPGSSEHDLIWRQDLSVAIKLKHFLCVGRRSKCGVGRGWEMLGWDRLSPWGSSEKGGTGPEALRL